MDEVVSSENYGKALKKVIENKGAFNWSVNASQVICFQHRVPLQKSRPQHNFAGWGSIDRLFNPAPAGGAALAPKVTMENSPNSTGNALSTGL